MALCSFKCCSTNKHRRRAAFQITYFVLLTSSIQYILLQTYFIRTTWTLTLQLKQPSQPEASNLQKTNRRKLSEKNPTSAGTFQFQRGRSRTDQLQPMVTGQVDVSRTESIRPSTGRFICNIYLHTSLLWSENLPPTSITPSLSPITFCLILNNIGIVWKCRIHQLRRECVVYRCCLQHK